MHFVHLITSQNNLYDNITGQKHLFLRQQIYSH